MAGFNKNDVRQFAGFAAENLKEKAQILAGKSVVLARNAAEKAKVAGRLAVVNGNIAMEKQNLAAARQTLGAKYFDYYGQYPADVLKNEVDAVRASMEKLEALYRQAEEIRSETAPGTEQTQESAPAEPEMAAEPEMTAEPENPAVPETPHQEEKIEKPDADSDAPEILTEEEASRIIRGEE